MPVGVPITPTQLLANVVQPGYTGPAMQMGGLDRVPGSLLHSGPDLVLVSIF